MDNRKKNLLVWTIIWGGLLLVVLYSPIGSPDLYAPKQYFNANQGVQFSSTAIVNYSPSIKSGYQSSYQDISVPEYNLPELKNNTTYAVSVSNNQTGSTPGNYNASGYNHSNGTQEENQGGGIAMNLNALVGKTSSNNTNLPKTGFLALTTDVNSLTNTGTRQGVGASDGSGGADPGGDPMGQVIPVGDGWGILIFFGVCYLLLKKVYFKKYSQ